MSRLFSNTLQKNVIVTGPVQFSGFNGTNTNAAVRYIQVYDSASLPGAGAVPIHEVMAAAGPSPFSYGLGAVKFDQLLNGLTIVVSTTSWSYTDSEAKDVGITVFGNVG